MPRWVDHIRGRSSHHHRPGQGYAPQRGGFSAADAAALGLGVGFVFAMANRGSDQRDNRDMEGYGSDSGSDSGSGDTSSESEDSSSDSDNTWRDYRRSGPPQSRSYGDDQRYVGHSRGYEDRRHSRHSRYRSRFRRFLRRPIPFQTPQQFPPPRPRA